MHVARSQGDFQCLPAALRWKPYHPTSLAHPQTGTIMGSEIHAGNGPSANVSNNVDRGSGRRADQLTNFTHRCVSLRSLIPQHEGVFEEGPAGTDRPYKVILLLSSLNFFLVFLF